ncbi:flagellar hook-length control protein FliK [Achromobacter kerstersii]|uniref:flagellar hook-length control protein FliK n=1 Tax=Achromobacter kerstersii TaxID=1353890 RepID=UPI0006C2E0A2|nr:flagellar hook-length control protein FliK [Achromobacter kerstersii]CUJ37644.1 Flagellar hook-length control protein [Achromobacter kerstersii]
MTAPLPLPTIAPVAPTSIADALGANKTPANKKGPSFSDVLAQQRPKPSADSRPANNGAKTPGKNTNTASDAASKAEGAAAAAINDAVTTATAAEAGALAVAAQQPAAPVLPQQALDIAAQAAEQVQLARGNAQAAATAMSSGAAVLTAALTAADSPATAQTPVAATALQAEAAAAIAARNAQAAQPVLTEAVKPGSAVAAVAATAVAEVAPAAAKPAAKADTPRLAPEIALPRVPRATTADADAKHTTTLPAHTEEELTAALNSTAQQFQAPQHGASAQDQLAQALAAATQRQAAPVANQAAIAAPAVPVVMQIATPVGGTHWGTELGQQVVMMSTNARQGMQTAELRLDPPDLGPLRVSLNLADGVASASFVSAHASVRQAIETAIPQLQQALAQAGISLGQTSVGEQTAQQEFAQQNGNGGSQRQSGGASVVADGAADNAAPVVTASRNANALVDTFA